MIPYAEIKQHPGEDDIIIISQKYITRDIIYIEKSDLPRIMKELSMFIPNDCDTEEHY